MVFLGFQHSDAAASPRGSPSTAQSFTTAADVDKAVAALRKVQAEKVAAAVAEGKAKAEAKASASSRTVGSAPEESADTTAPGGPNLPLTSAPFAPPTLSPIP